MVFKWEPKELDPREVMEFIDKMGAPTTKEVKEHFETDSASIRVVMGRLMQVNKVFPMAMGKSMTWMRVDGKRGWPSPYKRRAEAGVKTTRKKKAGSSVELSLEEQLKIAQETEEINEDGVRPKVMELTKKLRAQQGKI